MGKKKVRIGLSGGIDSTIAAYLLKESGYDVTGYTLVFGPWCRSTSDAETAAEELGIPLEIIDAERVFRQKIIAPFVEEYRQGRTPSPCPLCNPLKFTLGLETTGEEGSLLSSGHYAIISRGGLWASPHDKDQSYFLARLPRTLLSRMILPLGEMTKEEVRAVAAKMKLSVAGKNDSQDICFVPEGDYRAFLQNEGLEGVCGDAVDEAGHFLCRHDGYFHYTRGQRFRLGGTAERLYVLESVPSRNRLVIGPDERLYTDRLEGDGFLPLTSEEDLKGPLLAKVRSRDSFHPCLALISGDSFALEFENKIRAATPGQLAVLYKKRDEGLEVVGSGWIL